MAIGHREAARPGQSPRLDAGAATPPRCSLPPWPAQRDPARSRAPGLSAANFVAGAALLGTAPVLRA
jgi:hypothetical protein